MYKFITYIIILCTAINSSAQCYELVWADEFNGTAVDTDNWSYNEGASGWGNNELQNYTNRVQNSSVQNGHLRITALQENYQGANYTSARLLSRYKADFRYGRMEVRAQVPYGQGIWPAIWMMPTDELYGGWPRSGEIDIMEFLGHDVDKMYMTAHYGTSPADHQYQGGDYTMSGGDFSAGYHDYSVEWEPNIIRWFVDGVQRYQLTANDIAPYAWPFDQEFYFILNCAVGGNWPGPPDNTTVFPQYFDIEYVRVYQQLQDISIDGDISVFPNSNGITYSVPDINGATYNWTIPSGATLVSGQGTSAITLNWANTGGIVSVNLNTACGSQTYAVDVNVNTNVILNSGFEDGVNGWNTAAYDGAIANFNLDLNDPYVEDATMCVDVTALGPNFWNVQLSPGTYNLDVGQEYTLKFWAKGSANGQTISCAFINASTFYPYYGQTFTLSTVWQEYTYTFTNTISSTMLFNLDLGYQTGEICFDEVRLEADICTVEPEIINLPSTVNNAISVALNANPPGGTFSGPGVILNAFSPTLAGPGLHQIEYNYNDGGNCDITITESILVVNISYNFVNYNLGTINPE